MYGMANGIFLPIKERTHDIIYTNHSAKDNNEPMTINHLRITAMTYDGFYTQKMLIERGWTKKTIDLWLGDPDKIRRPSMYSSPYDFRMTIYLYSQKRVSKQERNKRFIEHQQKVLRQRKAKDAAKHTLRLAV